MTGRAGLRPHSQALLASHEDLSLGPLLSNLIGSLKWGANHHPEWQVTGGGSDHNQGRTNQAVLRSSLSLQ